MKKLLTTLLLLVVACLPGMCLAATPDLFDAVNKAGYQRMLSQRIVKAYCQVGLGVLPEASQAQLSASLKLFEERLVELKPAAALAPFAKDDLARLQMQWKNFKKIARGPVNREGAARLQESGEEILRNAERLTEHLQDAAGGSYSRLINISGRQRMLSQRLSKYYMLRAWGIQSARVDEELESAINEFSGALAQLIDSPENTPEIRDELGAIEIQWRWFQAVLAMQGTQSYPLVVADAGEAILSRMDRITSLYKISSKKWRLKLN